MNKFIEQLRALDPNDVGRWPLPFRIGTIALIFIIACSLAVHFLAWKPRKPVLEQAQATEAALFTEFASKQRKAANLEDYKSQLREMEQSFGTMLRQLPNKTEVPNLLVDISQTGLAAGLEEKLFQPEAENRREFYAELPIKIRLTGSYHAVGTFVSGVAALPRIVTVHDLRIEPLNKAGGTDDLQLDLIAKTYRYLDEEEQAEAQQQPAKQRPGARPAGG